MKTLITSLILCASLFVAHGQTNVKAKEKSQSNKIKYVFLPEKTGFENYTTAIIKVEDFTGKSYIVKDDMAKIEDGIIQMGSRYLQLVSLNKPDGFNIDVKRTKHSVLGKEIISSSESFKKPDGSEGTRTNYSYKLNFKDEYQITIKDGKNGNAIILEKEMEVVDFSSFPGDYVGNQVLTSERALEVAYFNAFHENDNEITEEEQKVIAVYLEKDRVASIFKAFQVKFEDFLESSICKHWKTTVFWTSQFKTKEEKFNQLDSAQIYMDLGLDVLNDEFDLATSINFHSKKSQDFFAKANKIYTTYFTDEYISMLDSDSKEEYTFGMSLNIFYSAVLSSNFEQAASILEQATQSSNNDLDNKEAAAANGKVSGAFGLLSRTENQKLVNRLEALTDVYYHEIKNYDAHKVYYKFN